MNLSPLHEAHIRKVAVDFDLTAPNLNPGAVSESLGLTPSHSAKEGDERRNVAGELLRPHEEGWWQFSSRGAVESKNVNDHFRYILEHLLPQRDKVLRFAESDGETYFGVLWKSTNLYSGTGPMVAPDCIAGMAELKAEIGFDIYQVVE